jgi:cation diffusion facilitator family transporter
VTQQPPGPAEPVGPGYRSIRVGLYVAVAQTAAMATAAAVTRSASLTTQTATSLADVAGSVFLLIGVVSSARAADEEHPLGYGGERFFWSLFTAVGVFLGGFGVAAAESVHALLHPHATGSYAVGYAVLALMAGLDAVALAVGLRPMRRRARRRHLTVTQMLWRGTDPAVTTVILTSATGLAGAVVAAAGLAVTEVTGRPVADAVASALIGLLLLVTSVVLMHTNRELLTGKGLPASEVARMRSAVKAQPGVVAVPDLFAMVVGPATLIVNGDVVFEDALDVPGVEAVIVDAAQALRRTWPAVAYVYLNPVAAARPRRHRAWRPGERDDEPGVASTRTDRTVPGSRNPLHRNAPRR